MEPITPNLSQLSFLDRFNKWVQESIMIKLFSIGFLLLILLIPATWIQSLISERQSRATDVLSEVAGKWSGPQTIAGPVLVIPFKTIETIDKGKDGIEKVERIDKAFFLPEQLNINGKITPEVLNRGIFDAVVYNSALDIRSTFNKPDFTKLNIAEERVQWKDAYLAFGISDVRGISEDLAIKVGSEKFSGEPSSDMGVSYAQHRANFDSENTTSYDSHRAEEETASNGIICKLNWENAEQFKGDVALTLNLKGSNRIDFAPAGKTTDVSLAGAWGNPSFDGDFLPTDRNLTDSTFTAKWKVLHYNRPLAQQWINNAQSLAGSDFGAKLLIPVDQYQKSMRSSKYGILVILLTFIALFLVEITQKIRIHPFQYILVGAALTIYYTLLLSFSEHIGYNVAYIISSIATVALVSLYSKTFLENSRLTALFTGLLVVFYTFIFVIILQQDYALLIGSIGLFMIIGMLMYFSRKVSWYGSEHGKLAN
jgi:inner membrane protein